MTRLVSSFAGAAVLTLALAGCSMVDEPAVTSPPARQAEPSAPQSPAPSSPAQGTTADLATAQFAVRWQDAVKAAQDDFSGKLSEVGMDTERTPASYKVELVSKSEEYEVLVDAETGALAHPRTEKIDADDVAEKQNETVDPQKVIPWDDALATALDVHGGPVVEWKLEGTRRGPQYQFDIGSGADDVEVTIDAITGDVRPDD